MPLPSLLAHLRSQPQLLLCSLLLALAGLAGGGVYVYQSLAGQQIQSERYGQALADTAARQAVEPALNQDMISLQVIVRELTRHPGVVGATVHDVENRLLVQSGHNPDRREREAFLRFGATIALHNNIAGQLRVTLERPRLDTGERVFLVLWGLGFALLIGALWLTPHWQQLRRTRASAAPVPAPDTFEPEAPETPTASVRLSLYLNNLATLYNQLNSEGFSERASTFEQQLKRVLNLYSGERRLLWGDVLIIDFAGDNNADCSFRALCAAQLLSELCQGIEGPRLRLSASIQALPDPSSPASLEADFCHQFSERRHPEGETIVIAAGLIDPALEAHAEITPGTGELKRILPPYRDMLTRQCEQLLSHQ
ncbi:hypothetical protein [Marinimicrobium alkaliphilum]|uniref:hypothetical protein n=1 Tax=Marinimicrobium alkaliphilum TaxID=2202654 RepID=UPI000DB8FFEB|nr:hypothetical protein [Marinimicrobium alkaliphilum]